ncbi:AAA family ATPase [Psychrobacter glaciei]|uniref:AAA family ATPase n=1 Tax=Psychrobacter glaciei TaxID=619771 RepID=UPI001F06E650|nr:ATP-binding protein [Psychrobacter glaciei]MCH1783100.1 ATP-binding protein [Psychrobacter glaciei]
MTDNPSITIKNFKSYKDATLPLSPLTLLIGANASGKSNAIEAFRFLSWVAGGERLSTLKNRVNDSDKVVRGSIKDLAFNSTDQFALLFKFEKDVEYEGVFDVSSNNIELRSEIIYLQENRIVILENLKRPYLSQLSTSFDTNLIKKLDEFTESKIHFDGFVSSQIDSSISFYKNNNSDISAFLMVDTYITMKKNNAWIDFDDIRKFLQTSFFFDFIPNNMRVDSILDNSLRPDGSNIAGVLYNICKEEEKKSKLLSLVQSLPEQDITDIKFYKDHRDRIEFALVESFGNVSVERTMDLLSDGTLKVLGIAAALLSVPAGSTVVIEEIDNSIHPTRAHIILSLLRQYAEERKLNLLLSTHNPALMDALPDEALADVVFCYRDPKEGDSRLVRLGDLDDYLGLVAQGSLGDLVTQGIVERFVKHPTTPEQRKKQALNWLNQLQGAD